MLRLEQHKLFYSMAKERRSWFANQLLKPIRAETPYIKQGQSKREGIGKSGGNIHDVSKNRGCGSDAGLMQLSFSVLVWSSPVVVMATVNCHSTRCACHLANAWQWADNEAQGPLGVKSSAILDLGGSSQFLFFFLHLPPETDSNWLPFEGGAGGMILGWPPW